MRHNRHHEVTDPAVVGRMIAENPWATIVSGAEEGGPIASHYPVLLDEGREELTVVTHVGRPDQNYHRFGESEMLLIVAGPHGYVSPSWYEEGDSPVPTWNFSVAHCYGIPEVLDAEENLQVLARLVDHFERRVDSPVPLDEEVGRRMARGTVGIRLPISRFVCKVKMSQDKLPASRANVLDELGGDGPYAHQALADEMKRALDEGLGSNE